jgi:hypothetical protein
MTVSLKQENNYYIWPMILKSVDIWVIIAITGLVLAAVFLI